MSSATAVCLRRARRKRLLVWRLWRSVDLTVDEQAQAFLEGQVEDLRGLGLLGQGLGHTGQAQLGQTLIGGMVEHDRCPQW